MIITFIDLDLPRFHRLAVKADSFKASTKFSLISHFLLE